jgi:hypothetical protein
VEQAEPADLTETDTQPPLLQISQFLLLIQPLLILQLVWA